VASFPKKLIYAKPGARIVIPDFFSELHYHKRIDLIKCVNQLVISIVNASLMMLDLTVSVQLSSLVKLFGAKPHELEQITQVSPRIVMLKNTRISTFI